MLRVVNAGYDAGRVAIVGWSDLSESSAGHLNCVVHCEMPNTPHLSRVQLENTAYRPGAVFVVQ
jgi:hypothetical protein